MARRNKSPHSKARSRAPALSYGRERAAVGPEAGKHARPAKPAAERLLKTLERVLSKAGIGSRSEARRIIHAQRVEVNGRIIENPDHWVDLERDRVRLDG